MTERTAAEREAANLVANKLYDAIRYFDEDAMAVYAALLTHLGGTEEEYDSFRWMRTIEAERKDADGVSVRVRPLIVALQKVLHYSPEDVSDRFVIEKLHAAARGALSEWGER